MPSVAPIESTSHVQEMHSFKGIESFFFHHTGADSVRELTPEFLWPERATDWLYDYICRFAERHCTEYRESVGVEVDDFSLGLIDPGYLR
jgi:hypothetical protein